MSILDFLNNDYETIEDGPVEIQFEDSKKQEGRIKVAFIVDFGKTDFSPSQAATAMKAIVAVLRTSLNVELSKCQ